jgi:hypothetical protein
MPIDTIRFWGRRFPVTAPPFYNAAKTLVGLAVLPHWLNHGLDRPGSWWFTANPCPALPSMPRQIIEIQFGRSHAQSSGVDNRAQQSETPNGRAGSGFISRNSAAIFNTERLENVSPAFEAWLRAYRTRLERACIEPPPAKSRES